MSNLQKKPIKQVQQVEDDLLNIALWKKHLYIVLGIICASLGVVGIFLPILPTTPFLLLSSYLFLRSSKKLYNRLLRHKVLGPYIYNYTTYKAIPIKAKVSGIILLWLSISISIVLIQILCLRILLILIAIGVTIHLGKIKTL